MDPTGQFWSEIWEYFQSAISEIGKTMGRMSPAYAGCAGMAAADGPLPFGDIVALGIAGALMIDAIRQGIYNSVQKPTKSVSKDKEVITKPVIKQQNYWSASLQNGIVTPITPLTYSQACIWVSSGNNLLCSNHAAAIAIVKFYPSARWDPAHGSMQNGYLNHYHLSSAHTNHIWYYGE